LHQACRTETPAEKAAFLADVQIVSDGLGLSEDQELRLKDEHPTWTSLGWTCQHLRLEQGRQPIASTPDLSAALTQDGTIKEVAVKCCPVTYLLLVLMVSAALTSVEGERGFSLMKLILTRLRASLSAAIINNLMMVNLHAPTDLVELAKFLREAVDCWYAQKKRRLASANYNNDADKLPVKLTYKRTSKTSRQLTSFESFKPNATLPMPPPDKTASDKTASDKTASDKTTGVPNEQRPSTSNAGIIREANSSYFSGTKVALPFLQSDPMAGRTFSIDDLGQFLAARPVRYPASAFFGRVWDVLDLPGQGGSSLCAVLHMLYAICVLLALVPPADLIQRAATSGSLVRECLRELLASHHQRLATDVWEALETALEIQEQVVLSLFKLQPNGTVVATGGTALLDQDAEGWQREKARFFIVHVGKGIDAGHFVLARPNQVPISSSSTSAYSLI
jgi:hypothetical protein